jgi:gamma-glutamyltranspeptidase / glutathione hydrolase
LAGCRWRGACPGPRLAEEGFPVAPLTSFPGKAPRRQLRDAVNGVELTIDGRGPQPGEIFRNPGLVRTFDLIASGGKRAYYEGPIAESISAVVQEAGGCLMQGGSGSAPQHLGRADPASYRD